MTYSRDGASENTQFSTTGLQHMRTVLSMESMGTQPILPPLCHPASDRLNKTTPYSLEDFKRDVELRATFFKPDKVIITPVLLPPHPSKLAALLLKAEADTSNTKKDGQGNGEKKHEEEEHDSCAVISSESVSGSPSHLMPSVTEAAMITTQTLAGDVGDATTISSTKGDSLSLQDERCDSLRKSPSLCRSDVSLDGSIHDSSLTSYQVPSSCHGHSTPVGRGGASGEGEGPTAGNREGTPLSLTPVKRKKETTPKPRPLLVNMQFFCSFCVT